MFKERSALAGTSRQRKAKVKLKQFRAIQPGWHYGEGVNFTTETLANATRLADLAIGYGVDATDAFPGADGEVMVTLYHGHNQYYLEFTVEPDGKVHFLFEEDGEEIEEGTLDMPAAKERIRMFWRKLWSLSGSFTETTTMSSDRNSKAWPSNHPPTGVFRSLTVTAPKRAAAKFVITSGPSTIRECQVSLQFSGPSRSQICQKVVG